MHRSSVIFHLFNPSHDTSNDCHLKKSCFIQQVGMLVPYKTFGVREYTKAISAAMNSLEKGKKGPKLGLFERYMIHVKVAMIELTPSPTGKSSHYGNIIDKFLCYSNDRPAS